MRALDDVILARLGDPVDDEAYRYFRSVDDDGIGVTIIDGFFDARPKPGELQVISYPMPYAVFYSSIGDDDEFARRLDAHIPRDSVFFSFTYVGLDRRQAKGAGERIHAAMRRWRPTVAGFNCEIVQLLQSQRVRRDDDAIHANGSPLFYGVTDYAVGVRPSA